MILGRQFFALVLVALLSFPASPQGNGVSVLFFGNSITYVGNLPAVFTAVCAAAGSRCSTEMIVQGGAALTERVADQSLTHATADRRFDYLILQERGGDLIDSGQERAREQAESAASSLIQGARQLDIEPILLGTYQVLPAASSALVTAESRLAADLRAAHVPISNLLACGRSMHPALRWFAEDDMHPGPELTLMMAVLLYKELFGSVPSVGPITVHAPIYGVSSGLSADSFASDQPVPQGTDDSIIYDANTVKAVFGIPDGVCK